MKILFKLLIISILAFFVPLSSKTQTLPIVTLKDLKGNDISTKTLLQSGKPTIISFWATWCKPCLQEINAINENLLDWQQKTGVRFIAISIDDNRSKNRVPAFVRSKKWNFEVFLDENGDFQRSMNVLNVPHTFIFDAQGKQIYQHNTYAEGDEDEYLEVLKKLNK
jgi:cytochrome c biogenesis protein CcmG, thiol:disulfide interchange protein DsbE